MPLMQRVFFFKIFERRGPSSCVYCLSALTKCHKLRVGKDLIGFCIQNIFLASFFSAKYLGPLVGASSSLKRKAFVSIRVLLGSDLPMQGLLDDSTRSVGWM